MPGSRHLGTAVKDRTAFWPLYLYSDQGSTDFMARDRAFWKSLDPDLEGTWTAVLPDGARRTLPLRLSGADDELTHDFVQRGWARYGINLLADKPYWLGETVTKSWGQGEMRPYYITAEDRITYGYPDDAIYYLSPGGSLGTATFTNDGDVASYPAWTVIGQTTAVSFGVDGKSITVPFEIPEGYAVQLDSDPTSNRVLWYGEWDSVNRVMLSPIDRTSELDPASQFGAIPRGQDRPVSIAMTGSGTVIAAIQNKYRRAW
ncbi:hypothetical protein G9E11_01845 [Arthrobacter sp. IA7]|uniref:hypothetical protein n=1 Tax=Arthrobacter ipis TaxID=2716202 RepID=UPI001686CDC8|nr:hypothetical protein [Arthrobacter ipis]MBD1541016.1 hypothetical protein [Arthrobacter ipis]